MQPPCSLQPDILAAIDQKLQEKLYFSWPSSCSRTLNSPLSANAETVTMYYFLPRTLTKIAFVGKSFPFTRLFLGDLRNTVTCEIGHNNPVFLHSTKAVQIRYKTLENKSSILQSAWCCAHSFYEVFSSAAVHFVIYILHEVQNISLYMCRHVCTWWSYRNMILLFLHSPIQI